MIRLLALAIGFAAMTAGPAPARAAEVADRLSPDLPEAWLSEAELSKQRGGFSWSGLDINFGAEIRAYIGDQMVMQTNVSWTNAGADVRHIVSAALTPAAAAELRAGLIASTTIDPDAKRSMILLANNGQTAFLQRTDGAVQNIIVNTASNVDLRQQVDATLDLANFAPFRNGVLAARIGSALATMRGLATIRGMPN